MKSLRLRPGKERSLLKRHPWVFDGAVESGRADAGETVRIDAHDGSFLGWAAYSPQSSIRARVWSFDSGERIDAVLFGRRIAAAVARRDRLAVASDAVRLVHAEADGLPGLIVDRYGDTLCAQFGASGVERWKPAIVEALRATTGLQRVYERSDTASRTREGLAPSVGWLGTPPSDAAATQVDVATGHKTGHYLDQRDNRLAFADAVRRFALQRVLNCYCYTGGFSVAALAGGAAEVTSVDSSAPALAHLEAHLSLNGLDASRHTAVCADVNQTLRRLRTEGRRYDAIVLDPPKFAPTAAAAERAAGAYKDINRLAFELLAPGGALFTFSCSGAIGADLFHKIVAGAGLDTGIDGDLHARLGAAPDHPTTVTFPEGEYLKGLVVLKR